MTKLSLVFLLASGLAFADSKTEAEVLEFNLKKAQKGFVIYQVKVADGYQKGLHGFPQDLKKATYWWEKATITGHARAQYELALDYERKGENEAFLHWLKKSANQGFKKPRKN